MNIRRKMFLLLALVAVNGALALPGSAEEETGGKTGKCKTCVAAEGEHYTCCVDGCVWFCNCSTGADC